MGDTSDKLLSTHYKQLYELALENENLSNQCKNYSRLLEETQKEVENLKELLTQANTNLSITSNQLEILMDLMKLSGDSRIFWELRNRIELLQSHLTREDDENVDNWESTYPMDNGTNNLTDNLTNNLTDNTVGQLDLIEKKKSQKSLDYGYWKSKAIEIKIEKNEVFKDRFGQVVKKMVKCDVCDNVYTGKTAVKNLTRHYRSVHQDPKKKQEHNKNDDSIEKCKLCDKIYRGSFAKTAIKMHMTRHEGEQRICHLCGKDFKNNLGFLVRHLKLKHICENVCKECGKAFTTKEYLKDHFDRNHAAQRIKSLEDPKIGENVEDFFENGMMIMDTTRMFKCKNCGKDFGQRKYAQQGLQRHNCPLNPNTQRSRPETCNRCEKVFSAFRNNKRNLKRHQEMVHEGKRDFQCDQCSKQFAYKGQYQNHILSVHEGVKPEPKIKDKICPYCLKLFSSNYKMTLHINRLHEGKEPSKASCDICSKTVSNVKMHIARVHEGQKDWHCDHCDKCFSEKGTLRKHIKHVHEGIRDKICPQCGKGFVCSKDLSRHLEQVHQKIRANRCEFCNKSYSRVEYLRIHEHTIHGKELDPKHMNQYL